MPELYEFAGILVEGDLLLTAVATLREETRGGHVRSDFTERDDAHWLGHTYAVREADGSVTTSFHPVPASGDGVEPVEPVEPVNGKGPA